MRIDVHRDPDKLDYTQSIVNYLEPHGFTLIDHLTVDEAIAFIREQEEPHLRYFYVVNADKHLVGVVSSHNLLVSSGAMPICSVMDERPLALSTDIALGDAIRLILDHELVALPAVDNEGRLVGVLELRGSPHLHADEDGLLPLHKKKARYQDIFQLMGVTLEKKGMQSPWKSFLNRAPWLSGNIIGGLICAAIAAHYQLVLETAIVLAMFIPLVLTLSESIAMQAMTLSLTFLHKKQIPWLNVFQRLINEWKTAVIIAFFAGFTVEVIAFVFHKDQLPYLVILVSIFSSMLFSATLGVLIPVLIHHFRLDPKIAAGPIALTLADVGATALYLSLAAWWIL